METLDWTKPLQTKDGKSARLLGELVTIDQNNKVVAVIVKGNEVVYEYDINGKINGFTHPLVVDIVLIVTGIMILL